MAVAGNANLLIGAMAKGAESAGSANREIGVPRAFRGIVAAGGVRGKSIDSASALFRGKDDVVVQARVGHRSLPIAPSGLWFFGSVPGVREYAHPRLFAAGPSGLGLPLPRKP